MPPRTFETVKSRHAHQEYRYSTRLSAEMRTIFISNPSGANWPGSEDRPPAIASARASGLPGRNHFFIGREAAGLLLRIAQLAVDRDFEHTADPRDQFDLGAVFLSQ